MRRHENVKDGTHDRYYSTTSDGCDEDFDFSAVSYYNVTDEKMNVQSLNDPTVID